MKKRKVTLLWKWWHDWWTVEMIPRCRFGYHEEDRLYCSVCCYVIQDNVHKFHYKKCFDGLAEDDPRRLKLLKMIEACTIFSLCRESKASKPKQRAYVCIQDRVMMSGQIKSNQEQCRRKPKRPSSSIIFLSMFIIYASMI
jgi:hypothetical protein